MLMSEQGGLMAEQGGLMFDQFNGQSHNTFHNNMLRLSSSCHALQAMDKR